jgi:hypothetical protein
MADIWVYYEHNGTHEAKRLADFQESGLPKSAITGYIDADGEQRGGVPDALKAPAPKTEKPKDDGA